MANKVKKQPYEAFVVSADFSKVLTDGEAVSSVVATAEDTDGTDVSDTFLNQATADHDTEKGWVQVQDGDEDGSPYKVTIRVVTDQANKWEVDIFVEVEEI
jgi:hypothetical protein